MRKFVQTLIIHQNLSIMKKTLLSVFAILSLTLGSYAQWIEQATGFPLASTGIGDVCAVDANIVWAVGYDGSGGGAASQAYTKTSNGGTTWVANKVTPATGTSIANICALSATKAWTVHYYPAGSGTKDGIYYTSDGGTTWTQQTSAAFSNSASFPNTVWFWDDNNGYCMGDPIAGEFEIYTTTNGGTTWTIVPGANIANPVAGEFGVVGYHSIVGNTVWFGTNKGRIYKSIDKGLNWTAAVCTPINNKYIMPFFKDANFGLVMDKDAATSGFLAMTTDGGATFSARNNLGNTFTNDMDFVDGSAKTWVTTGADAAAPAAGVTYSFDDGANWLDMPLTIGTQFLATDWLNDSTAWAGGFNTDATTGGMFKFDGHLVPANFTASDTAIALGGQVTFSCTSQYASAATFQWTFQGGVPGTSTAKTPPPITYSAHGDFNVTLKITSDWGVSTTLKTAYIYVGGVGINERSAANISVYPNPTTDVLNINANMNIESVKMINLVGQTVITHTGDAQNITLNTSGLKSGIYTLQIKMADGFINKKIVVN